MSESKLKETPSEVYLKYALFEKMEYLVSLIGLNITNIKPHDTIPSQLHLTRLLPDGKMELLDPTEPYKDPSFVEPDIVASAKENGENIILHSEVQSTLDDMLQRMFFYYAAIQGYSYFKHKIRQILIDCRDDKSHFGSGYTDLDTSYNYRVIKLNEHKARKWLESGDPVLMTLYLLTQLEDKRASLLEYIEKIDDLKLSGEILIYTNHLFFAVMRVRKQLKEIYVNEVLNMRTDFKLEEDTFYQLGEERGIKLGEKLGEELGEKRGMKLGEELGEERGINIGQRRAQENFARRLLANKVDIKAICEYTSLSEEEVLNLKR